MDDDFEMEEFDVVILDGTTRQSYILSNLIKLNCHKLKPVLVLVGNISAREENCIWGMGATDVLKVPLPKMNVEKRLIAHIDGNGIMIEINAIIRNTLTERLKEIDL